MTNSDPASTAAEPAGTPLDGDAANALRRAGEAEFRYLFMNHPHPMWVYDLKTLAFLEVNDAAIEHYGYSRDEFLHLRISDIRPPEDMTALRRHMASQRVGLQKSGHWRHRLKDGRLIDVEITSHSIRFAGRAAIVVSAQDISDRLKAEDEIYRLNAELERRVEERTAQLEAANRDLEAFSYSVSHDLRAPLRSVSGFAQVLLEDYAAALPPEAQRYLLRMQDGARRMGQLIDDLLAFSRLGRQPLVLRAISPTAIARQALDMLEAEQRNRRITITIDGMPDCQADPALLLQVYVNLLANALKFTRTRDAAEIHIGWRAEATADGAERPVYFVRDNGVGFDPRYADKLFGVFQRLHAASEYEGTGVGLATVQRIIQRHGGTIWAAAQPDKGAVFSFTLGQGEMDA